MSINQFIVMPIIQYPNTIETKVGINIVSSYRMVKIYQRYLILECVYICIYTLYVLHSKQKCW